MAFPAIFCDICGASNRQAAAFCSKCGNSLKSHSSIPPKTRTITGNLVSGHLLHQRYSIVTRIGQGGMGSVYKAEDHQLGKRLVAVKEMSQDGLSSQDEREAIEAFKREALMLAYLQHHNLPNIYDHFFEAEHWYLVMSFIEGETLEDYLGKAKNAKLPIHEVLDIGIELCKVLKYLHSQQPPIIFRDLKPANIMRTGEGHLYLIDFGIARHFKPGKAKDTIALGSPGYASPEQYKRSTGPQSDIYSLGAVLHQLLSGNDPSENPFIFTPLQLNDQPSAKKLAQLVLQMVEMDVNKRPSSMAIIEGILNNIKNEQINSSGVKISSRSSLPLGSTFSSTITSTPLHSLSQTNLNQVTPSTSPTVLSNQVPILNTYKGHNAMVWELTWSPNGKYIASASEDRTVQVWDAVSGDRYFMYGGHKAKVNTVVWASNGMRIASGSNDNTVHIWPITHVISDYSHQVDAKRNTANGNDQANLGQNNTPKPRFVTKLTSLLTKVISHNELPRQNNSYHIATEPLIYSSHSKWIGSLAWSPDGQRIVSAGGDRTVQVWNATTGKNISTFSGHSDNVQAVAWSPDGQYVASSSDDRTVRVWDAKTGFPIYTYAGHSGKVKSIAWSPDSKCIASASYGTVHVWDALTGHRHRTYNGHRNGVNGIAWSPDGKRIASAGSDQTVQIWEAQTGNRVYSCLGHSQGVKSVAWSPSGLMIASTSWDHTVRVWQVS